jgi:hypothetical protein
MAANLGSGRPPNQQQFYQKNKLPSLFGQPMQREQPKDQIEKMLVFLLLNQPRVRWSRHKILDHQTRRMIRYHSYYQPERGKR